MPRITPKKRFEILSRDNFTCRYCGRSAPEVILEVDHIIPRKYSGSNENDNLITACRDCNRGKGASFTVNEDAGIIFVETPKKIFKNTMVHFVYAEPKTKRVQLIMQPSVVKRARLAAESINLSLNEYIHRAITEKLDREGSKNADGDT